MGSWLRACARGIACVAVCGVGMTAGARAEPDEPLTEQEFLGDLPVVLSVSRLSQPVADAPSAVTVIDRDMIRLSGARDIPSLLRLVPGFYAGNFLGNEPIVSRGITTRYYGRIQMLVDGRSVYTPLFGQVPWTSLPVHIEDIERIEVTRGPNAASYGANSFLGVINIITRQAQEDRGALALVRAGEADIADGMLRYGGRSGDLDYRLTLAYQSDDGLRNLHDFQRVGMVSGRGDYRLNASDALQFQFGYGDADQGQGWADQELNPPHTQHVYNSFVQLKWQRVFAPDDEAAVQFYHTLTRSRESATTQPLYGTVNLPPVVPFTILPTTLSLNTDAERYDLEFQRNQNLGPAVRLAWGANARLDRVWAPLYLGTDAKFDTELYRLFGNAEWRATQSLVFNAGATAEHNSMTGGSLSPRGAVSYHFAPGQTVRVGVSKAQRTPTVLENSGNYNLVLPLNLLGVTTNLTVPEYFGPGKLDAERIISRELAYIGEWPAIGLTTDVRLFQERMSDIINVTAYPWSVNPAQSYYVYGNLDTAETQGVETQVGWRGKGSRLWLTHAYRNVSSNNPTLAAAVPQHVYSMLAAHTFPGAIDASVIYYHVDAQEPVGDGSALEGYQRIDLRLAQQIKLGGHRSEVALVAQNIGGSYLDYNKNNEIERRIYMTLRVGF
jgi:iron complex outermembrane receptor protein